jgi:hypothetical protein
MPAMRPWDSMTVLLAGTADGVARVGEDAAVELAGHEIVALISNERERWAIADGLEIWRSTDRAGWEPMASLTEGRANCLAITEGGLLIGTSDARLARLAGRVLEPLEPFDRTSGREDWYTPWGGPPDVRSISASDRGIFVNVHVGGIPRSTDGGASWEPTIDIDADVHQVVADPASDLILAACAEGLAVSGDGGESWDHRTDGLHAAYCRAVAVDGEMAFISASTGPRGGRAAVYRGPLDGSGPFERCNDGLPGWFSGNIDTACLVAKAGILAFGTADGEVFVSEDQGSSWTAAARELPAVQCLAIL